MLMMFTVWFDTSGMGRLMVVLFVLLASKVQRKWQLMLVMRTVWFDTSGMGRLMVALFVLLAFKAADAHDAHGLV